MRFLVRTALLHMGLLLAMGMPAAAQAPDPLIGTWNLDLEKSTSSGVPPRAIHRTFDYSLDGLILVTYETTNARGEKSFVHWYMGIDGKSHPEFGRPTGAAPIWMLTTRVVDSNTKEVVDRRVVAEGRSQQVITYTFVVSDEGQTLTITARSTSASGEPSTTVQVYNREY
jgi:hypothetical protein